MKKTVQEKGTLLLAFIAGLSINGTCSALFNSIVPFSIFPIISLALALWCLHQRYLDSMMPEGLPGIAAACFVLGILVFSAVIRAEYPDIGPNFLPSVLAVIVLFWIGSKVRARNAAL